MSSLIRSLAFGIASTAGMTAMAQQPYTWVVSGVVNNCYPGQTVDMQVIDPNGVLLIAQQVVVDPVTCSFSAALGIPVTIVSLVASTQCDGMVISANDTAQFTFLLDTAYTNLTFNCGGINTYDCLGILNGTALPGTFCEDGDNNPNTTSYWDGNCVCTPDTTNLIYDCLGVLGGSALPGAACDDGDPMTTYSFWNSSCVCTADTSFFQYDCQGVLNGPAMPGTACTIPGTILEGTWSANCSCESNDPAPCEAGFWVMQAYAGVDSLGNPNGGGEPVPNLLWVWNLSSGGTGEFTYLWSFGDGTSSTEAFPTHTYANGGPYALCLTILDVTGCTDTYCDSISVDENGMYSGMVVGSEVRSALTINVIQPLTTGVLERPVVAEMATWPNPVTDELNIQLTTSLRGSVSLDILDLSGRTLVAGNRILTNGANRLSIPTSELTPGVYMLRIGNGNDAQVLRFVKTR